MIIKKSAAEIEAIAASGRILARCHRLLRGKARAGVTTAELDRAAERFIRSQGAEPVFKGYRGFPGSICASPNSMVVHGIPGPYRLARGDVLSIDIGVLFEGWVADAAVTLPIGPVTAVARGLLVTTRAALFEAIAQCRAGNRLGDVSAAVQRRVEADGLSVIRSLVGHGVGRDMHEDPQIPNFGRTGTGPELEQGMVFAIEPMVNAGGHDVRLGKDKWAVYSQDGSLAAHFEHTVAITADGPRILTPWHDHEDPARSEAGASMSTPAGSAAGGRSER
ncbi:MAG: type I methionyl aminopeptidase [Thermoleophilaceae bacterium]